MAGLPRSGGRRRLGGPSAFDDDNGVDPLGHESTVWLQELDPAKPLRHAMHVNVSVAREQAEQRLAAALATGGQVLMQTQDLAAWILADRAGNRVCVNAWPDGAQLPMT
jgi:4a-hydroxytetrahydrobiopterin dehydratase